MSEFKDGFADDLRSVEQPEVIHRHNPQIPPGVVRIRSMNAQSRGRPFLPIAKVVRRPTCSGPCHAHRTGVDLKGSAGAGGRLTCSPRAARIARS